MSPGEGGRPVRGFRPSRYGLAEEETEEAELVRLENVEVYARRAKLGLPIFEEPGNPSGGQITPQSAG